MDDLPFASVPYWLQDNVSLSLCSPAPYTHSIQESCYTGITI